MYGKTPYMSMIIIEIIVTMVRRKIMITTMIGMPTIFPRTDQRER